MLFNSLQFAVFFVCVLALHRAAPEPRRNGVLIGASLVFYLAWVPVYLLLLLALATLNFLLLRAMAGSAHPRRFLVASILLSVGVLGVFKYAAFVMGASAPLVSALTGSAPPIPELVLPLGISFYTFQMIGLVVDAYREPPEEAITFREYLLFVSFFPQLVAGPILRGRQLLPQIRAGGTVDRDRSRRGLALLASGVVKKMLVADFLLAPFVELAFDSPIAPSAPVRLLGAYSFAFQIYFDFSGYTDMARGLALLLGYELPKNFLEPYLSRSPVEFWRRWHVTLSQWLRDYVYVPLGGNRGAGGQVMMNLMLTMVLGGLWHGAGWAFLAWGAYHGLLLVAYRLWQRGARVDAERPVAWRDAPAVLLVFHLVALGFVIFRSATLGDATAYLADLATGDYGVAWPVGQIAVVLACALLHPLERLARLRAPLWRERLDTLPGGALEGAVAGVVLALAFWIGGAGGAFIYFQF